MVIDSLALRRHIKRQELWLLSQICAWCPVEEMGWSRWERELNSDLLKNNISHLDAIMLASRYHTKVKQDLHGIYRRYGLKEERVAATRDLFNDLMANVDNLAAALLGTCESVPIEASQLLYKLYDGLGHLLYIGITDRGPTRLVEHYRHKEWFPLVARVEFERYATREIVLRQEEEAIKTLKPLFNIAHNQRIERAHA